MNCYTEELYGEPKQQPVIKKASIKLSYMYTIISAAQDRQFKLKSLFFWQLMSKFQTNCNPDNCKAALKSWRSDDATDLG